MKQQTDEVASEIICIIHETTKKHLKLTCQEVTSYKSVIVLQEIFEMQ